jgi:hypothetical protein
MTTWNLKEFRELVERARPSAEADRAKQAVDSVGWKLMLADYHAEESRKALLRVAPDVVEATRRILLAAKGGEDAKDFRLAAFASEAHLIACAQALHSTGDILAHAVFWATRPSSTSLSEHQLGLERVIATIANSPPHAEIRDRLLELQDSNAFRYIGGYVNITKHRRLLNLRASVHFDEENAKHGLRIQQFDYKGTTYPETWTQDLVEDHRRALEASIFAVGNALNDFLR